MTRTVDTLIVGQGLAGSILAWTLRERGGSVLVIDDGHRSAASVAAAGLINPLAGMRFGYSARTADWLVSAEAFYTRLATRLGGRFLHPVEMLRLFRSERQLRFWQRRADDPGAVGLLGPRFDDPGELPGPGEAVHAPFGGFVQHRTGYVEVTRLLTKIHAELQRAQSWRRADFAYAELRPFAGRAAWRDVSATRVVFCEGHRALGNPWFGWLPFQPDKGEILTLAAASTLCQRIVNGAHWLIPLTGGGYRFGSTHDHQARDKTPTRAGRDALLQGLAELLGRAPECAVTDHRAGVRPATRDRLPLLGRHPNEPALYLFNGFGARGSLTIPWYAERFVDYLLDGAELPAEADLRRHA